MPSDSNEYIRFTSSQFTEDREASLKTTMLMRLIQLLKAWNTIALSATCWVAHRGQQTTEEGICYLQALPVECQSPKEEQVSQKSNEQVFQLPHSHGWYGASRLPWLAHSQQGGGKKQVETLSVGMSRTCQTLIRAYMLTNMSKNEKE